MRGYQSQFCFKLLVLLAVVAIAVAGCKSKKELKETENVKGGGALSAMQLYDALEAGQLQFEWLEAAGKMRAQTETLAVGFGVKLRMRKDSAIWLQAEKFGFEVGRTLIRPDSAFVIDRFNREYYAVAFEEFAKEYKVPFTFFDLQRVLAGGVPYLKPERVDAEDKEELTRLTLTSGEYKAIYWLNSLLDLDHGVLVDNAGRSADFNYSDYRAVNGVHRMPYQRTMSFFDGQTTSELSLQVVTVSVDIPASMRFTIPDHYEKVD